MKNASVTTLLSILNLKNDYELRSRAKKEVTDRYGFLVLDIIETAINAKNNEECSKCLEALKDVPGLRLEETSMLTKDVFAARKKSKLSMPSIMELYRSDDEFLSYKAKEHAVQNYDQYIYSIVHKCYSTYADKYMEELYQCGVIGVLNALKGYDIEKGKFTTYSKPFIIHEMREQLNFHHNDTTVHYNNIQKKIHEAIILLEERGDDVTISKLATITELRPEIIKREMEYMERTRFLYLDSESEVEQIHEYFDGPEELSIQRESSKVLYTVLASLPKDMRDIVIKKFIYDLKNEEIAEEYGLTPGKVKTIFQRGIKQIKEDPRIKHAFSDRISIAEREMLKFSIFIEESNKDDTESIDDLLSIMDDLPDEFTEEEASTEESPEENFSFEQLTESSIMQEVNKSRPQQPDIKTSIKDL